MDLPGLCIDLLDALELSDLLKHSGIAKEVESLEAYLGTAPLVDIEHVFPKNAGDNVENLIMLTRREHQVVGLIGQGVRNKEIAEQLGISESTAKWYVGSILEKLGLSNRDELLTTSHRSAVEDRRKGDDQ